MPNLHFMSIYFCQLLVSLVLQILKFFTQVKVQLFNEMLNPHLNLPPRLQGFTSGTSSTPVSFPWRSCAGSIHPSLSSQTPVLLFLNFIFKISTFSFSHPQRLSVSLSLGRPVLSVIPHSTEKERQLRHLRLLQFINFLYSPGEAIIKIARCARDTCLSRRWAHLFPEPSRCLRALQEMNTYGREGARC